MSKSGKKRLLNEDEITASIEECGEIASRIPHYESRKEQVDLTRLIIKSFNEDAICACEAGTGVGKSFAYLLPAMRYVLLNEGRVVVSTATINLQEQLYQKDVPFLLTALGENIKIALVKGRGNFLCRRRLEDVKNEMEESGQAASSLFEEGGLDVLLQIIEWSKSSKKGEKSELDFEPPPFLWAQIASDSDSCNGSRCPLREICFFMESRKEAENARLLIVNHHLLFADLEARSGGAGGSGTAVLPFYDRVIIDEAHKIEGSATSFFSSSFSRVLISRILSRLYRRKGARESGLLVRIRAWLPDYSKIMETEEKKGRGGKGKAGSFAVEKELTEKILLSCEILDEAALALCGGESVFRFIPQRGEIIDSRLIAPLKNLNAVILKFCERLEKLILILEEKTEESSEEGGAFFHSAASIIWEIKSARKSLLVASGICREFENYKLNEGRVLWVERRSGKKTYAKKHAPDYALWTNAPLEIGGVLKKSLFEPNKTVVCLSATLTPSRDFTYWKKRMGLLQKPENIPNAALKEQEKKEKPIFTDFFNSPFPYQKSVLLAVSDDSPPVESAEYQSFVNESVLRLCEVSGGGALILFTSYESLRLAFAFCEQKLAAFGIKTLKQGEVERSRLLRSFLENENSVLFATDSFWEGIDVPGDALRLVIICRLPFSSPADPVAQARRELLEKEGRNPFLELTIPDAVMKFRQGFGRLMRRASDRGVVAVLDGRITHKSYGKYFISSLPQTRLEVRPIERLLQKIDLFLNG
ncbi:MAG: ATP-dependent DNA helicase DinG [Spirochaetaceae bacterium]|jgi:ATP-dependent DNA helicase DinG|nr:ATP-dependent DNA helicase DinG [Spirochaetaceae bacterium]